MQEVDPVADGKRGVVMETGSYVWNLSGRLLRVPGTGQGDGRAPVIQYMVPGGPPRLTLLSPDPRLPVPELRVLSTAASIHPRF